MDRLEQMFDLQYELNRRIGVDTKELETEEQKTVWIKQYSLALYQELGELVDSVGWKHWKKNQKYDEANLKVEIVDCFHFLISLAQVAGMSAPEVFERYIEKNKVNHQRQDTGY